MSKNQKDDLTAPPKTESKHFWGGGRNTDFRYEYCQMLVDFFENAPTTQEMKKYITETKYEKNPSFKKDDKDMPNLTTIRHEVVAANMPKLYKFADKINVSDMTLENWRKKYPEWDAAYKRAEEIRKGWLNDLALAGLINPQVYKFMACNFTDMKDMKEMDLGNKDDKPFTIKVL